MTFPLRTPHEPLDRTQPRRRRARLPRRPAAVWPLAVGMVVVLVAFAARYGYHRDELYFLAAGRHLDWAYPDQGPLTPLIARLMTGIAPGSLVVLRLPSALAAGATVGLTGALARELGGDRRAQALAAACAAVAVIVLFTGHTLSTSTFDLLVWTAATGLVTRAVRTRADRLWPLVGLVLGVGLLNKPLPAFLALGLLAGVVLAGPRRLLGNRFVWLAAAIAVTLWSPWLVWQAVHGWPQLALSRSIAAGGSASSRPWWQIIPFQALLAGPVLAPVWIAGLVRLFRDPGLRELRFLAWAWVVLAAVFMATDGKPYYLAGLLPVLLGSGAVPVARWTAGGRLRRAVVATAVAVSALAGVTIALPVLPADRVTPVVAMNPDVGETIGWPELVQTVADVDRRLPDPGHVVILTANYGEAGAIDRYGPALGLPRAYSGHNGYGYWGAPPDGDAPVIAVGLDPQQRAALLRDCTVSARISDHAGIDNDENGAPVATCAGPLRPWPAQWPTVRHIS